MEKKLAFVFPGQGAQYPGMAREFYREYACVRDVFDIASDVLRFDVAALCFDGAQEELNQTVNTQVCVLASDLAAAAVAREHGLIPSAEAGFSLGEYAALVDSGAIGIRDAFSLVRLRAEAMLSAASEGGGMVAVIGVSTQRVEELCGRVRTGYAAPANFNSPVQTAVAGDREGLAALLDLAEAEKIRCQRLAVSVPSHCALMLPAAEALRETLAGVGIRAPRCGLVMNANPSLPFSEEGIRECMYRQLISPVRWVETQQNLRDRFDAGIFIECGPGRVLSGLARRTVPGIKTYSIENMSSLNDALSLLQQA